jgi:reactive chlorine resistance protein C
LTVPIWDPAVGFPFLGPFGQFLIKDVCLLG